MSLNSPNYFPLGSTIQKINVSLAQSHYEHFGLISASPKTGHMVLFYRRGVQHVGDCGEIFIRHSEDGGDHWSHEFNILSLVLQGLDARNLAGGYDSNGRLYIFYVTYNPTSSPVPQFQTMMLMTSNDDGQTWTTHALLTPLINLHTGQGFSPYGHIIDLGTESSNGVPTLKNTLFQTWYWTDTNGKFHLLLYKSTDGGLTFPTIIDVIPGGTGDPLAEPSMVYLGGGCLLMLARVENRPNQFKQFKSEDWGNTWMLQDISNGYALDYTDFENISFTATAPPWLSYINYEGIGIVACYYTIREPNGGGNPILKVAFALATDLINDSTIANSGPSAWDVLQPPDSPKVIDNSVGGNNNSGYQSFFHPLNQFKGIGVCFADTGAGPANPIIEFTQISGIIQVIEGLTP